MITGIEIDRFRGIHEGKVADLTPLTVLVGPSGAGKSTVLDALLIGASGSPGDAVGRVVRRRPELPAGARWLFERSPEPGMATARITIVGDPAVARNCELSRGPEQGHGQTPIATEVQSTFGVFGAWTVFTPDNGYDFGLNAHSSAERKSAFQTATTVRLIEAAPGSNHESLPRLYSRAAEKRGDVAASELISDLLDGATGLMIQVYDDGERERPILHVAMDGYTVPLAATGSGIYSATRLLLELAACPAGSLALVEEPEVHQHPAVIHHTARLLLSTARRGVQVIVSTHSLDLLDSLASLVAREPAEDVALLSAIRVMLDGGTLRSSNFTGSMVVRGPGEGREDLR